MTQSDETHSGPQVGRRQVLQGAVAVAAAGTLSELRAAEKPSAAESAPLRGRIRQSIVHWCFNSAGEKWDVDRTCQAAKELGCVSVEIIPPKDWPTLRRYGLTCAIAPNGM